jgi:hypothetical protein
MAHDYSCVPWFHCSFFSASSGLVIPTHTTFIAPFLSMVLGDECDAAGSIEPTWGFALSPRLQYHP